MNDPIRLLLAEVGRDPDHSILRLSIEKPCYKFYPLICGVGITHWDSRDGQEPVTFTSLCAKYLTG